MSVCASDTLCQHRNSVQGDENSCGNHKFAYVYPELAAKGTFRSRLKANLNSRKIRNEKHDLESDTGMKGYRKY